MSRDLHFDKAASTLIQERTSWRSYDKRPLEPAVMEQISDFCEGIDGPFGTSVRFQLVAAADGDHDALKSLGTYGMIKNPTGFVIGAMGKGDNNNEDYGYAMEAIILRLTDLGLGSCWLGGTFSKSTFSKRINCGEEETVPAVASTGYRTQRRSTLDRVVRWGAGSRKRIPWEQLFFRDDFTIVAAQAEVGELALPLEMVRLAPSASNKQPWRILLKDDEVHFYLRRTKGYGERNARLFGLADMQRIDLGIALCHFDLMAREVGLPGSWRLSDPGVTSPWVNTEYTATWSSAT